MLFAILADFLQEKDMILKVAEAIFDETNSSSAGIWAYGHVKDPKKLGDAFKEMRKEFSFFYADANKRMTVDTTKLHPDDGNVG
ncbi:unnamed protein product [Strongylus vulgaris]|uniref:Uncharacterized protein n=1 Tax=Strongylus vulgaris TaxID=40348 RepID=A0A3P7JJJ4_STRVU|nr:unnamed protein product [Strongylus vulgaris]